MDDPIRLISNGSEFPANHRFSAYHGNPPFLLSFISRGYFNHTFKDYMILYVYIYIKRSCFTVVGSKGSIRWCRLSEPSVRTFFGVEKLG